MLNVTYTVPAGQEATPVYEAEGGIPVTVLDEPYLDSTGLQVPLPVVDVGAVRGLVSDDSMQSALAVSGLGPPPEPEDAVTVDGIPVTHNGEVVTHA